MRDYKGKVLLITNVASQCGFTESNYQGLQILYEKYNSKGFEVRPILCVNACTQQRGIIR